MPPATVVIGAVGRPHGVRGAVRARPFGATLADLAPGEEIEARPREGTARRLVLAGRAGTDAAPILTFAGLASREEAAALTGALLAVPGDRVVAPAEPDTFLVSELVGCRVLLGERELGSVSDVVAGPANDALEVVAEGGPLLVPFTADAVADLDVAGGRIVLRADLFGPEPG